MRQIAYFLKTRWRLLLAGILMVAISITMVSAVFKSNHFPILTMRDLRYSGDAIPDSIAGIDGRVVEVVGQVWNAGNGVDQFSLTEFPPGDLHAEPYLRASNFVHVHMNLTLANSRLPGKVRVRGIMHIKIEKDSEGQVISIYHLDAQKVTPAP